MAADCDKETAAMPMSTWELGRHICISLTDLARRLLQLRPGTPPGESGEAYWAKASGSIQETFWVDALPAPNSLGAETGSRGSSRQPQTKSKEIKSLGGLLHIRVTPGPHCRLHICSKPEGEKPGGEQHRCATGTGPTIMIGLRRDLRSLTLAPREDPEHLQHAGE
ncbi:hypothetical protein NDU88_001225 [Pleurodeles waltl]|uniref:Uncharacterized protein n=1 Tax=Pleurodeles waltl TaxID=8319 RepID=A0AAV7VYD1_PLEWA|nr:hypothetical protein NDU88_001225 [Pleurodeles waltl]